MANVAVDRQNQAGGVPCPQLKSNVSASFQRPLTQNIQELPDGFKRLPDPPALNTLPLHSERPLEVKVRSLTVPRSPTIFALLF